MCSFHFPCGMRPYSPEHAISFVQRIAYWRYSLFLCLVWLHLKLYFEIHILNIIFFLWRGWLGTTASSGYINCYYPLHLSLKSFTNYGYYNHKTPTINCQISKMFCLFIFESFLYWEHIRLISVQNSLKYAYIHGCGRLKKINTDHSPLGIFYWILLNRV